MTDCTVSAERLDAYADGTVSAAEAFVLEAHLLECRLCQTWLSPRAQTLRLDDLWGEIEEQLDAPRPRPIEAGLRRAGVPEHLARLVAATPALTVPWLAAVAVTLGFAAAAARYGQNGLLLFLSVAALLPLAGVAASFGPALDPTYELGVAAPTSQVRVGLLRTCAVLALTITLAAIAALTLPGVGWLAAAWLAPSLGLTGCSLALSTFVGAERATLMIAGAWIAAAVAAAATPVDRLVAFELPAQGCFLALAVASVVLLTRRADRLNQVGTR